MLPFPDIHRWKDTIFRSISSLDPGQSPCLPVSLMDFVVLGKSFKSEWAKSECLWKWAANLAVTVLFGEMMMNWFCMSFPLNIQVPTSPGPPLRPRFTPAHHDSHAI